MALKIGAKAIDFNLPGVDGKNHSLKEASGKKATVVFFSCNHCPYARAYEDRIVKFFNDYSGQVAMFAINANDEKQYPQDSFGEMRKRAAEKEFKFPYLRDESQQTAKAYGAERTPEFFVFNENLMLVYHGAFDDNWNQPDAVSTEFVRSAAEAVLNGEDMPVEETNAVGCTIKWKP